MKWRFPLTKLGRLQDSLEPQFIALGDFTINAIPEGRVVRRKDGHYDICLDKMFIFINDIFNFEGEEYLGAWDLTEKQQNEKFNYRSSKTQLFNSDVKKFRRHGYGRYVPVLSKLHQVEDFEAKCVPAIF